MTMLDGSIVNISLPSIAHTFHTPVGGAMEWVIIAYLATIAATLLTFGRLSDMVGRKPVWLAGLALFTIGSGICGAASSLPLLIAARAFQGLGGSLAGLDQPGDHHRHLSGREARPGHGLQRGRHRPRRQRGADVGWHDH